MEFQTPYTLPSNTHGPYPARGVFEFGFGGDVRLTTQNPYPFLGVILAELLPVFRNISQKIQNFRPVFRDFIAEKSEVPPRACDI